MHSHPSGCYYTDLKVIPKDWKTRRLADAPWTIYYRFYDPAFREDPKNWGKLILIRGMNIHSKATARREITRDLIDGELGRLQMGYNPITNKTYIPENLVMDPRTPVLHALQWAAEEIKAEPNTHKDYRSVLKYFAQAARILNMCMIPIEEVRRRHMRPILDQIGKIKGDRWTANNFNFHRANLGNLFAYLMEYDVIEANPVLSIKKMKTVKRIKEILTEAERAKIKKFISGRYPEFYRFINIFYHGGARKPELLRLRGKDVNLEDQCFRRLIKKGRHYREIINTIPDIALSYWREAMEGCGPEDYLFGRGLKPGPEPIKPYQITHRWEVHVKGKLKIQKDFNCLRHMNATDLAEQEGEEIAAQHLGHTSTAMVRNIYDVNRLGREHEKRKKAGRAF